jgi:hypothetical protein
MYFSFFMAGGMYLHTIQERNVRLCVLPQWKEDSVISVRLKIDKDRSVTLYKSVRRRTCVFVFLVNIWKTLKIIIGPCKTGNETK